MTPLPSFVEEMTLIPPCLTHELIRGQEQLLVEQIGPLVRSQNVALDMRDVERIDAAGIAALISLYGCALKAGHRFSLINAPQRVAEILAIVGLDHILLASEAAGSCIARPAA
jgi:anti-anti-sigma factor